MGAKLRVVRRRIRSVQSTMKITRAMELIAASRIVKAQERVFQARPYADLLTAAMEDVARQTGSLVERIRRDGMDPVMYASGKKAIGYFRFRGIPVETSWSGFSEVPRYDAAAEIGERLIGDFRERRIDELNTVYTDFRSAFTFRATDKLFLPIAPEEVSGSAERAPQAEYIFEPEPAAILDELLPQYIITKIFFALLESAASENAARQRAMAAATDNAEELIKVLTRQANRARQDEITTEIMEIVGGAEALAQATSE